MGLPSIFLASSFCVPRPYSTSSSIILLQSLLFRSGLPLLPMKNSLPGFAKLRAVQYSILQYLSGFSLILNNLKWKSKNLRKSRSYLKALKINEQELTSRCSSFNNLHLNGSVSKMLQSESFGYSSSILLNKRWRQEMWCVSYPTMAPSNIRHPPIFLLHFLTTLSKTSSFIV
jgi:hypothetical protein